MKYIIYLLFFNIIIYASTFNIDFLKGKEVIYFLEKSGYHNNYFLSNEKIKLLFKKTIKHIKTNKIKILLDNLIKNTGIVYKIKNNNIYYSEIPKVLKYQTTFLKKCNFNKNFNSLNQKCQNKYIKTIFNQEDFIKDTKKINNEIFSNITIKNNKEVNKLFKIINYFYYLNQHYFYNFDINYYNTNYNLIINKNNFKQIQKKLLDIPENFNIKNKNYLNNLKNVTKNITELNSIIKQYENNLILLYKYNNKLNKRFFPYIVGKAKINNKNYYFIKNININIKNLIDYYNQIYMLSKSNFKTTNNNKCYIKNDKIVCIINNFKLIYN